MADVLRLGYVGAGYLAQRVHLPNLAAMQEERAVQLVGLAEVRPKLARTVAARFRIPKIYASHRELAEDPDIDAIALSGHFAGQGEIARELLEAGKDVFMEKPMAVSVAQAERILEAEKRNGVRLMVGYMKRYDAGNALVHELIDGFRKSGELGGLTFIRNHGFCGDWIAGLDTHVDETDEKMPPPPTADLKPGWMPAEWYPKYVGYLQQYTHNVNLLRWFAGAAEPPVIKHVELDAKQGYAGVVVMEVGGVRATLESGWVAYHAWDEHTQVYFDRGWIRTEAPPLLQRNQCASVEVYRSDKGFHQVRHFPLTGWTWSYKEELRHFVECLRTGTPFRSPASDALADVQTFETIYRRFLKLA